MRLIDADTFKKILGTDTKIRKTFCEIIDKQPTAYNVEKVIEELRVRCYAMALDESQTEILVDCVRNGGTK